MNDVGTTHAFVLSKGFAQVGNHSALIGEDDTRRLFAEVYADPDRPDVRPQEAYKSILSSIQPGWTLRLLQLFWPDPEPRLEFQKQVSQWETPLSEGLEILHQGLSLAVQEYPLPFVRRTVLEFVLPGDEGIAWWEGLSGLCGGFGLRIRYLDRNEIEGLTRWVLNPNLEYHQA
ncbi:MAG TPA: hypothetical protein PK152_05005 [Anaerolineales bacterium]|nr:hypothetical protein [Anaerolineae bacterium]HRJ57651.1 hypothetical protein [Anaerolineales bacterium]HRK88470.1 hypothetical protein [Anaerolineales bacterium]